MENELTPDTEIIPLSNNDIVPIEVTPISKEVKDISPVLKIETGLSNFLQNAFNIAEGEQQFHKRLQEEVINRLNGTTKPSADSLKNSELIALLTSNRTNVNDLFSKLVAPTLQLATARQQNEMAKQQKTENPTISQTNIQEINNMAPAEVLAGMKSLFDLAQILKRPEEVIEYSKQETN